MPYNPTFPTFGTEVTPQPKIDTGQDERDEQDRIKCINAGGKWDYETKTCSIPTEKTKDPYAIEVPKQEETVSSTSRANPPRGTVVMNEETGEAKGFIDSQGNFVKAGRRDIEVQVNKRLADQALRESGTVGDLRKQQAEAEEIKRLTAQIGNLTPEQMQRLQTLKEAPIDWGQAITAGTIGSAPSILTTVGGFAAGGALGAGPVGAGIGAAVGLIAGVWRGIQSNIKTQQKGEIGASMDALTNARTNMMKLSRIATDPSKAQAAIELYNEQLFLVYQARAQTQLEVRGNFNKYMEDGRDILSNYDLFLDEGGQAEIYGMRLEAELSRNIPLTEEELVSWELEE